MNITLEQVNKMTREEFENNLVERRGDVSLYLEGKYIDCPHDILGRKAHTCLEFCDDCRECWMYHSKYFEFKEDNKEGDKDMFTKKDLKSGMVIKNREGKFFLVVEGTLIESRTFDSLRFYKDDLTNKNSDKLDIMSVWDTNDDEGRYRAIGNLSLVEDSLKPIYERKEIDWSKIPVDTKVLVRDLDTSDWRRRHFAKFVNGKVYAFDNGMTSFTGAGVSKWDEVKLYEE